MSQSLAQMTVRREGGMEGGRDGGREGRREGLEDSAHARIYLPTLPPSLPPSLPAAPLQEILGRLYDMGVRKHVMVEGGPRTAKVSLPSPPSLPLKSYRLINGIRAIHDPLCFRTNKSSLPPSLPPSGLPGRCLRRQSSDIPSPNCL